MSTPVLNPEALRVTRRSRRMTGGELAKAVGVAEITVRTWEAGRYHPSHENLIKLAKALSVSTDELTLAVCPFCHQPMPGAKGGVSPDDQPE